MNTPNKKFTLPVLVSICVGLNLPQQMSLDIIKKAGFYLNDSLEGIVYNMILSSAVPKDILACNALIEEVMKNNPGTEIRMLGSQSYSDKQEE